MSLVSRVLTATLVAVVVAVALVGFVGLSAAPADAGEKIWILKFAHEHPKRIQMDEDTRDFKVYWYMYYTITNEDEDDHKFMLDIRADSDKGYTYHDGYYPRVISRLAKRKRVERHEIKTQREVSLALDEADPVDAADPGGSAQRYDDLNPPPERDVSKDPGAELKPNGRPGIFASKLRIPRTINMPVIKAGETWNCVAIFNRWDNEADYLTVRINGLTNDIISKTEKAHERTLTERVLTLKYYRPGDEFWTPEDTMDFVERKWIDVTRTIKSDLR